MLSVIMLHVTYKRLVLSVVRLNVVVLSDVAPRNKLECLSLASLSSLVNVCG
jgi:hypothetical protein